MKKYRHSVLGCTFCGKMNSEMGKQAQKSGCCQECYIERFASEEERQAFLEKKKEREHNHIKKVRPVRPGRIDVSRVHIKRVIYEE